MSERKLIHLVLSDLQKKVGDIPAILTNRYLIEISKSTKRKEGFIKNGVTDEMADMLLKDEGVLLLMVLPKKELIEALKSKEE